MSTKILAMLLLLLTAASSAGNQSAKPYDLVIYGGTAAAVTAAVQAKLMGKSVVIVSPDQHLGGLSSGGLGFTDTGDKSVIGGPAREFYRRVWKHYDQPSAWKWEKREEYGNKGQGTPAIDGEQRTMWIFEPHVAERIFEEFIAEYKIQVDRGEWLDREHGVSRKGSSITSITTLSGRRYEGKMFIDATYEGDLMAAAGVDYHVGREANRVYGEKWNGVHQKGLFYFIANDPRVPEDVRREMRRWGLARDEFEDNGNWPHQIYIREARRLAGSFVMTENELLMRRPTPDPVGMGSYTIDSHNVQRYITPDGSVQNEGDIGVSTGGPYQIAYGALVPKKGQIDNLLVPVCVSSSHIAFGSIRMEPVYMILGQSAATAAALAIDGKTSVQDLPYASLRERLVKDRQILEISR